MLAQRKSESKEKFEKRKKSVYSPFVPVFSLIYATNSCRKTPIRPQCQNNPFSPWKRALSENPGFRPMHPVDSRTPNGCGFQFSLYVCDPPGFWYRSLHRHRATPTLARPYARTPHGRGSPSTDQARKRDREILFSLLYDGPESLTESSCYRKWSVSRLLDTDTQTHLQPILCLRTVYGSKSEFLRDDTLIAYARRGVDESPERKPSFSYPHTQTRVSEENGNVPLSRSWMERRYSRILVKKAHRKKNPRRWIGRDCGEWQYGETALERPEDGDKREGYEQVTTRVLFSPRCTPRIGTMSRLKRERMSILHL